jgi:hypothetical protein
MIFIILQNVVTNLLFKKHKNCTWQVLWYVRTNNTPEGIYCCCYYYYYYYYNITIITTTTLVSIGVAVVVQAAVAVAVAVAVVVVVVVVVVVKISLLKCRFIHLVTCLTTGP